MQLIAKVIPKLLIGLLLADAEFPIHRNPGMISDAVGVEPAGCRNVDKSVPCEEIRSDVMTQNYIDLSACVFEEIS